ncbi:hypothetical protein NPIL_557571 [Nephila pilipes]|uniref:Uncharacterized protein n=1 Tax=Nephila pilipes TaxID=299642 RepID=A0A8X6IXF2_NEPPI|nr:hypothetical protein NPIL_557571 [Nephila pilipes]
MTSIHYQYRKKIMSLMEAMQLKYGRAARNFHRISVDQRITSKFHWKTDGTIDRLKTASSLIQSDVAMKQRFRLACNYWQERKRLSVGANVCKDPQDYFLLHRNVWLLWSQNVRQI